MDVIDPALGPSDMQTTLVQINLIPSQAAQFRGTKPTPVCDQDHGGVSMPVAGSLAGGFLEPLNLLFGQIFPGPELRIRALRGTVRFTMVEGARFRADFAMPINLGSV
jgi:hypothetical protein